MTWFNATVDNVLIEIENTDINDADFGGTAEIQRLMTEYEDDIRSRTPDHISQMVNQGKIRGHIIVESADEGQTDVDQAPVPNATKIYIFKNWRECQNPKNNIDDSLVEGTDYTLDASGKPTFAADVLSKGDNAVANYMTSWENSAGLGSLQWLLVEGVVLNLIRRVGITANSELIDDIEDRDTRWEERFKSFVAGDLVPVGVSSLDLIIESEVNNDSKRVRTSKIKRA